MNARVLRAGPLSMLFLDGDIRAVRLGGREVLQRVYVAVRDRNWGTIASCISGLSIEDRGDSFEIRYTAENLERDIHFRWSALIRGWAAGEIEWSMEGVAVTSFLKNRIGLCVLHPAAGCAGRACSVETVDGQVVHGEFPQFVAPHQPFRDMRAIAHEVEPGVTAEVRFSGDIFEMEDQRNWTDSSFKTYSTPLSLPYPALIEAGTEVKQTIRLTLRGDARPVVEPEGPVAIELSSGSVPVPPVGLCGAGDAALDAASLREIGRLRLAHLRLDLPVADFAVALEVAAANARSLGVPLEVFVPSNIDVAALSDACARIQPTVARWLAGQAGMALPTGAPVAAGSDANFAGLNRNRPDPATCDALWFAASPQVHAFDDRSIVENLPAQAMAVESAHRFAGGKPVFVSPVTLRMRSYPGPPPDPRQSTWLCAAWTLGSLRYLAGARAAGITYYEIAGERGVLGFPVFDLLATAAKYAGGEVLLSRSSQPLAVEALVLRKDGRTRALLANFGAEAQPVLLDGRTVEAAPAGITAVDLA